MADRTPDNEHGGRTASARQGMPLLTHQNRQSEALSDFLDEWAEETGLPNPDDVAAMRRRYFPQ